VTADAVRFSVERALSPKLGSDAPATRFMGDLVGARAFSEGDARRITGINVRGNTISFTLVRPSPDFLERLSLPFFCTVPVDTPLVQGGVQPLAPPSAGPYYMSDRYNGEYMILERNPNYRGPRDLPASMRPRFARACRPRLPWGASRPAIGTA
jgi:ABC-type transport system substrate-binding protein